MIKTVIKTLIRWLLPILAGALFTLGLAPFNFWPATAISSGLLACLLHHHGQDRSSWLTGWLYGAGLFIAGSSWIYVSINTYGQAPPPLATLLTGIFCLGIALLFGLQAWLYQRYFAGNCLLSPTLAFPALWVLFEWVRSWLLTGFPWLYAGYATLGTDIDGWAPIIGVYGLSFFLIALGSSSITFAAKHCSHYLSNQRNHSSQSQAALTSRPITRPNNYRWPITWIITLAIIAIGSNAIKSVQWTKPTGKPIDVALYQPNIPLEKKWDLRYLRDILLQHQATISPHYDLVLWPESTLPGYRHTLANYLKSLHQQAFRSDTALITGIPVHAETGRHNSIIALGQGQGEYHKQKLVPFGEYIPLENWLRGLIALFDLPMSNFVPGPDIQPVLTVKNLRIAPFICYEVTYPDFVTSGARDSNLLVTISNDSWFGDSIAPLQHLQMAQFRALETNRPMLRGTNNGITAIINSHGEIIKRSPQFEETILTGSIQPRIGNTPIMLTGSWPVLTFCLTILLTLRLKKPLHER